VKPSAIRVLIVDDSVVVRQVISDSLKIDEGIEIVAAVSNGRAALERLDELKPDLLTVDLEMPEMDGLTLIAELAKRRTRVPVIVFSTLTEHGAKATLEALARGASDYVCKPSGQRSVSATIEKIRSELIPKIHGLARRRGISGPLVPAPAASPSPAKHGAVQPVPGAASRNLGLPASRVEAVVIGVSTGGPSALADVIPHLPREVSVPILIVQHMPPVFTQVLAQRLAGISLLKVKEAANQDRLEPGVVYIAPGDYHMRIHGSPRDARIALDQAPLENGCRPAIDPLFQSAAEIYGNGLLAIVLTGVGHDGTKGAGRVRRAAGTVWVQDEATSIAWGMPSSTMEAGYAQRVLPLSQISRGIVEAVFSGQTVSVRPKAPHRPS
jgi:two-component system chemotaxis response regulator CheB